MNFSKALLLAKSGSKIARTGWNGKGMYVRHINLNMVTVEVENNIEWLPFLAMKTVDNKLVPWLASQTDLLAEDWMEVV